MQIIFQGQESSFKKTAKGGYSQMEISYLDERGGNKTWKIFSFSNPKVFDTFKAAKEGEVYEITTRKNDKDFTEWAAADKVGESSGAGKPTAAAKTPVVSQYETRDERNQRQRFIIRQSCLSNAIAMLSPGSKGALNLADVAALADSLVSYVYEAPGLMEMENDFPD
jgi:hypothetical protein